MNIHPSSIIDKTAIIEEGVYIGPHCNIGKNVKIMRNSYITHTTIDENTIIYPSVVIGTEPQDKRFKNELSFVKIGKNNIIRELTCIHRATGENQSTIIGDNNYIMAQAHIGHNCIIGNNTIISTLAGIAGVCYIDDFVIIGGMAGIHQKVRIGKYSIIGGLTKIYQDIPPFMMVDGNPPKIIGINREGMKRNKFSTKQIDLAKKIYKIIYTQNLSLKSILKKIEKLKEEFQEQQFLSIINIFLEFFNSHSERGIKIKS